jgi:hypothetical protein
MLTQNILPISEDTQLQALGCATLASSLAHVELLVYYAAYILHSQSGFHSIPDLGAQTIVVLHNAARAWQSIPRGDLCGSKRTSV